MAEPVLLKVRSVLISRIAFSILSAVMAAGAGVVSGQEYPNKPIRIITAGVGGGSDFAARLIAQGISAPLGQPVIVENRGGVVTAELAARATPDGYTISLNGANLWVTTLLRKSTIVVTGGVEPSGPRARETAIEAATPT